MQLSPTAQHDITRSMLTGNSQLDEFGELILRCTAHSQEFLELAGPIVNVNAKTGNVDFNDFSNPVEALAFSAMQEFMKTASPGTPRPTNGSEWMTAVRPHLQKFIKDNVEFPSTIEQNVDDLMQTLHPPDIGELDRACDGLVDFIRGMRLRRIQTETETVDPATRMARQCEVESSIRVPGSSERWQGLSKLGQFEATPFLIDNLFVEGTVGMIYGPPGDGKTFLALDIGSCVATGRPWNGLHTERGGVLYFCLEGGASFRNRMRSLKHSGRLKDSDPFEFSTEALDLRSPDAHTRILSDIKTNELKFNMKVKLVVIDTLAVATSGGNECTSEDMGAALAAIAEVVKSSGVTALLLHHPGKDVSRGPRGWSGIVGNLDTIIEMERSSNDIRSAKITKQKDGEAGRKFPFELEVVTLGYNERQKPVTSCIVKHLTNNEASKAGGDDQEGILGQLWAGRSADEAVTTAIVCEALDIKTKGGRGSTKAKEVMENLKQVGLVEEVERGTKNRLQWQPARKGLEALQRCKQSSDADRDG